MLGAESASNTKSPSEDCVELLLIPDLFREPPPAGDQSRLWVVLKAFLKCDAKLADLEAYFTAPTLSWTPRFLTYDELRDHDVLRPVPIPWTVDEVSLSFGFESPDGGAAPSPVFRTTSPAGIKLTKPLEYATANGHRLDPSMRLAGGRFGALLRAQLGEACGKEGGVQSLESWLKVALLGGGRKRVPDECFEGLKTDTMWPESGVTNLFSLLGQTFRFDASDLRGPSSLTVTFTSGGEQLTASLDHPHFFDGFKTTALAARLAASDLPSVELPSIERRPRVNAHPAPIPFGLRGLERWPEAAQLNVVRVQGAPLEKIAQLSLLKAHDGNASVGGFDGSGSVEVAPRFVLEAELQPYRAYRTVEGDSPGRILRLQAVGGEDECRALFEAVRDARSGPGPVKLKDLAASGVELFAAAGQTLADVSYLGAWNLPWDDQRDALSGPKEQPEKPETLLFWQSRKADGCLSVLAMLHRGTSPVKFDLPVRDADQSPFFPKPQAPSGWKGGINSFVLTTTGLETEASQIVVTAHTGTEFTFDFGLSTTHAEFEAELKVPPQSAHADNYNALHVMQVDGAARRAHTEHSRVYVDDGVFRFRVETPVPDGTKALRRRRTN